MTRKYPSVSTRGILDCHATFKMLGFCIATYIIFFLYLQKVVHKHETNMCLGYYFMAFLKRL